MQSEQPKIKKKKKANDTPLREKLLLNKGRKKTNERDYKFLSHNKAIIGNGSSRRLKEIFT